MSLIRREERRTHTGYAVSTSQPPVIDVSDLVVRPIDEGAADYIESASLGRNDRRSLERLVKLVAEGHGPAYLVSQADGTPILAALRLAGGAKTSQPLRRTFGAHIPFVGEREHLLAELWLNPRVDATAHARALVAVAFVDPPSSLARTVTVVPRSLDRELATALGLAQFDPYILCVAHFGWKRPWRKRIDWIGPPPPARSVISSAATAVADTDELDGRRPLDAIRAVPPLRPLPQEATP